MIVQLSIAGSTSIHEKNHYIKSSYPEALKKFNFIWNANIFQLYSHYKEFHALS